MMMLGDHPAGSAGCAAGSVGDRAEAQDYLHREEADEDLQQPPVND